MPSQGMDETGRVIITKRKTYVLPEDAQGQPIEQAWPKARIPASLTGAKIYQTNDGPVIAKPLPEDGKPV
jgi:hypothetical protein